MTPTQMPTTASPKLSRHHSFHKKEDPAAQPAPAPFFFAYKGSLGGEPELHSTSVQFAVQPTSLRRREPVFPAASATHTPISHDNHNILSLVPANTLRYRNIGDIIN